jgi:hypothetical protein
MNTKYRPTANNPVSNVILVNVRFYEPVVPPFLFSFGNLVAITYLKLLQNVKCMIHPELLFNNNKLMSWQNRFAFFIGIRSTTCKLVHTCSLFHCIQKHGSVPVSVGQWPKNALMHRVHDQIFHQICPESAYSEKLTKNVIVSGVGKWSGATHCANTMQ